MVLWQALQKRRTRRPRGRNGIFFFFVRVDFLILIQSSARTHVRMAVLIRCVTCFIFGDQEKFLAAKFTFQHFDLVSFTAERLFFSELRPSH